MHLGNIEPISCMYHTQTRTHTEREAYRRDLRDLSKADSRSRRRRRSLRSDPETPRRRDTPKLFTPTGRLESP